MNLSSGSRVAELRRGGLPFALLARVPLPHPRLPHATPARSGALTGMTDGPSLATGGAALGGLAERAGYRLEPASLAGLWLLIDPDGELVRTPVGDKAWSAEEAQRYLRAVAPLAPS